MGIAKETLAEFFRRHPEAQSGKLSMEELNLLMAGFMQEVNAAPKDDFDGLAAEQMHFLLHEPFGRQSVLAWGQKELDDQLVGSSPLLMLLDLLMAELDRQGELKLTTKGNLPVAVCTMLVERDLLPLPYGEHLKKPGEDKVPYLWPVKDFLLVERLAKKRNNKLSLTAAGRKFMELPTGDRFQALFEFFTDRFPWENLFDLTDAGYAGHLGWAYSLWLLSRYGGELREATFYSNKWGIAFEKRVWETQDDPADQWRRRMLEYAYICRFFECFTLWFGLAELHYERNERGFPSGTILVRKTALLDMLSRVTI